MTGHGCLADWQHRLVTCCFHQCTCHFLTAHVTYLPPGFRLHGLCENSWAVSTWSENIKSMFPPTHTHTQSANNQISLTIY